MKKHLFLDLLLLTTALGAALCIARGFLFSASYLYTGALLIVLSGGLAWLMLQQDAPHPNERTDDTVRENPPRQSIRAGRTDA